MNILLQGKSLKGKNRIQELGVLWEVVCEKQFVLFSVKPSPWLLLLPLLNQEKPRWIHKTEDIDFEIAG